MASRARARRARTTSTARRRGDGPYLSAALFCERVLHEADGVKSAIRIIDRVTIEAAGANPPEAVPPFTHQMCLFLRFKAGAASGAHTWRMTFVKPSGGTGRPVSGELLFPENGEEDRGMEIVVNITARFEESGLYWFSLEVDGTIITRIPFRVIYERTVR